MVDCLSASAQNVEAQISTKMTFRIAEVGFVVNINIFVPGLIELFDTPTAFQ